MTSVRLRLILVVAVVAAVAAGGFLLFERGHRSATHPAASASEGSAAEISASPGASPLSEFEGDDVVKVLRIWTREAAKAVNAGTTDTDALHEVETPFLQGANKRVLGAEVGRHYPGPIPMRPVKVTRLSPTERVISVCFVANGFSTDARTGKANPLSVVPYAVRVLKIGGNWLLDTVNNATDFSCSGITVPMPTW